MNIKRILVSGVLSVVAIIGSSGFAFAQDIDYKVQKGDTFWTISQKYGISLKGLMEENNSRYNSLLYQEQTINLPLENHSIHTVKSGETYWIISRKLGIDFKKLLYLNNATENSSLNIGDKVIVPIPNSNPKVTNYKVLKGDTYWKISQKLKVDFKKLLELNVADEETHLDVGQTIKIPEEKAVSKPVEQVASVKTSPYVTYSYYNVNKNDNAWSIAEKFGIPSYELLKVNKLKESTVLNVGDKLKIPVHHIPVKETPAPKFGELLDWWKEAQYVIPIGSDFEVVDFYTGKSFMARRTIGSSHADCETLTLEDTKKMKAIWGGSLNWSRRPAIIKYNGRKIAASVSAMPHAGNDKDSGGAWTSWRSGGYGAGENYDYIKSNGMDGHFDIHFLNSTRHKDGAVDSNHQANIKISGGF